MIASNGSGEGLLVPLDSLVSHFPESVKIEHQGELGHTLLVATNEVLVGVALGDGTGFTIKAGESLTITPGIDGMVQISYSDSARVKATIIDSTNGNNHALPLESTVEVPEALRSLVAIQLPQAKEIGSPNIIGVHAKNPNFIIVGNHGYMVTPDNQYAVQIGEVSEPKPVLRSDGFLANATTSFVGETEEGGKVLKIIALGNQDDLIQKDETIQKKLYSKSNHKSATFETTIVTHLANGKTAFEVSPGVFLLVPGDAEYSRIPAKGDKGERVKIANWRDIRNKGQAEFVNTNLRKMSPDELNEAILAAANRAEAIVKVPVTQLPKPTNTELTQTKIEGAEATQVLEKKPRRTIEASHIRPTLEVDEQNRPVDGNFSLLKIEERPSRAYIDPYSLERRIVVERIPNLNNTETDEWQEFMDEVHAALINEFRDPVEIYAQIRDGVLGIFNIEKPRVTIARKEVNLFELPRAQQRRIEGYARRLFAGEDSLIPVDLTVQQELDDQIKIADEKGPRGKKTLENLRQVKEILGYMVQLYYERLNEVIDEDLVVQLETKMSDKLGMYNQTREQMTKQKPSVPLVNGDISSGKGTMLERLGIGCIETGTDGILGAGENHEIWKSVADRYKLAREAQQLFPHRLIRAYTAMETLRRIKRYEAFGNYSNVIGYSGLPRSLEQTRIFAGLTDVISSVFLTAEPETTVARTVSRLIDTLRVEGKSKLDLRGDDLASLVFAEGTDKALDAIISLAQGKGMETADILQLPEVVALVGSTTLSPEARYYKIRSAQSQIDKQLELVGITTKRVATDGQSKDEVAAAGAEALGIRWEAKKKVVVEP